MRFRKASILILVLALLITAAQACRTRTRKKPVTPTVTPTATVTEAMPPEIPTTVATDTADFVRAEPPEPTVVTEELSADLGVLNERAQERGWIRDVFFEYDSAALAPDGQESLAVTASWLKTHPEYGLLIEGHCDERGTEQYNLALGDRRANIAREYLVTLGLEDQRLRTVSYGEERPFAKGSNEAAWSQNRRAHLVLVRP